jgi:hypothetical protein
VISRAPVDLARCIQRASGREARFTLTNAAVVKASTTGADGTTLPSLAVASEDLYLYIPWPAIGWDIRMFHIRPIEPAGGRIRKNT